MRTCARLLQSVCAPSRPRPLFCLGCWIAALFAILSLCMLWAPQGKAAELSKALPSASLSSAKVVAIDGEMKGGLVDLTKWKGAKGTVVIFVSTECPISNAYVPTYQSLAVELFPAGISVALVNPNEGQSPAEIAAHSKEYQIGLPVFKDPNAQLAGALGVTHCPEACLFDAKGKLVYRGRIDDRYVRRGGVPRPVQKEELRDAFVSLREGKPIEIATTEAIGCPIFVRHSNPDRTTTDSVHYYPTIATILQNRCQECHRPEGIGPFALMSYHDALSWAEDIASYTADRSMPPWKPVAGFGEFHNVRRMPADEVDLIARWVDADCPEGEPSHAPAPVNYPAGWTLGEPDLVLSPSEAYELAADGDDVYQNFVFKTDYDQDMYLSAYEILPGNRRVVHHVLMFLDSHGISEKLDATQPGPGYESALGLPGFVPKGGLGGWAPGNAPHVLEDGIVRVLPKGNRIVMQVHYHKTGKVELDQTKLGLYFSKSPPKRAVGSFMVLPIDARLGGMRITPGDPNYEVRADFYVNQPLEAITITPHMHLLGKDMTVTAHLPSGETVPLIKIDQWDFNWQETYSFAKPVSLPAGTTVRLVAHYDNSENNPYNPSRPPKLVTWGEQTTEEMCIAFLEVLPMKEATSPEELVPPDPFTLIKGDIAKRIKGLDLQSYLRKSAQ